MTINIQISDAVYAKLLNGTSRIQGSIGLVSPPKEKLVRLIMAMTCVENGIKWEEVDKEAIWQGYDLAFPGVRKDDKNVVWDEYWDWSPSAYGG